MAHHEAGVQGMARRTHVSPEAQIRTRRWTWTPMTTEMEAPRGTVYRHCITIIHVLTSHVMLYNVPSRAYVSLSNFARRRRVSLQADQSGATLLSILLLRAAHVIVYALS
jgi:hypothetical protein